MLRDAIKPSIPSVVMLSVIKLTIIMCHYMEYLFAIKAIKLIMSSVVMLSAVKLSTGILSVVMLVVVILLSFVTPLLDPVL